MKIKNIGRTILISFLALVFALQTNAQSEEDLILKAMQDELLRGMTELKLEGFEKPFYMSYSVSDLKVYNVLATLGAIYSTQDLPIRANSSRILVGDYEFNDESLDNNIVTNPSGMEISMPINDDYWGIRRALWSTTDNVYKNAARQFQKNMLTLAEQKKELKDVSHRSFAKTPPVNFITTDKPEPIQKDQLQDIARSLSAIFKEYKEIDNSTVVINYSNGYNYFVSSDGSVVKTYKGIFLLQISVQTRTEKGEPVFDQLSYMMASPSALPSLEELKIKTRELANKVVKLKEAKAYKDDYSGPVLFEGRSVANVFSNALFSSEATLMASNTIESTNGYRFDANTSLDLKVGKKITSDLITVIAKPKMKKYGEVDLIGGFEVDSEGVVPIDSLLLLEQGMLKNLLNDRTLTQNDQTATGHNGGPGVIEVSAGKGQNGSELKTKLIDAAKQEELDYALIVRDLSFGGMGFVNLYKVSLSDGSEELLRSANIKVPDLKSLKKLLAVSNKKEGYNVQMNRNGGIISIICPNAILVEDVDLKGLNIPFLKEEIYISNPLKYTK